MRKNAHNLELITLYGTNSSQSFRVLVMKTWDQLERERESWSVYVPTYARTYESTLAWRDQRKWLPTGKGKTEKTGKQGEMSVIGSSFLAANSVT